jgi:DNA-binding MarR family transcriptional regulator
MEINYDDMMYRVNCLASDLDSLYHQAAVKLGLSDSVMFVLYLVYEKDGKCPLNDIRKETSISKQTLNSAVRKLESEEIIYLEQNGGRAKTVCLTEKGKEYVSHTIARLFNAECSAFNGWTEEEISQYLNLMEKYNDDFRKQIEEM